MTKVCDQFTSRANLSYFKAPRNPQFLFSYPWNSFHHSRELLTHILFSPYQSVTGLVIQYSKSRTPRSYSVSSCTLVFYSINQRSAWERDIPRAASDHHEAEEKTPNFLIGPCSFAFATRGGVAMRSWPLLLPTFALLLAQAACVHHP